MSSNETKDQPSYFETPLFPFILATISGATSILTYKGAISLVENAAKTHADYPETAWVPPISLALVTIISLIRGFKRIDEDLEDKTYVDE